MPIVAIIAFL